MLASSSRSAIGTGALWQRAAPPDRSQRKQFRRSAHRGSYRRRIYVWPLQGSFEWFSLKGRTQNGAANRRRGCSPHFLCFPQGNSSCQDGGPHFSFVLSKEKSPPQRWKRKPLRNELPPRATHPKRGARRHELPDQIQKSPTGCADRHTSKNCVPAFGGVAFIGLQTGLDLLLLFALSASLSAALLYK